MDLKNIALIIVDMQNDFINDNGFVLKYPEEVGVPKSSLDRLKTPIPNIRELADFSAVKREKLFISTRPGRETILM